MNNTKLIKDKSSSILTVDDIILEPKKPGGQKYYCAIFKGISGDFDGKYKLYLFFYANNEFIGEKLTLIVKINKKDKTMIEIEENMDKINEFIKLYDIPEKDFFISYILKVKL